MIRIILFSIYSSTCKPFILEKDCYSEKVVLKNVENEKFILSRWFKNIKIMAFKRFKSYSSESIRMI